MRLKRYLILALVGALLTYPLAIGVVSPIHVSALDTVSDSELYEDEESTEPDYLSIASTSMDTAYHQYIYVDLDPDYVKSVKYLRRNVPYKNLSNPSDDDYSATPKHSTEDSATETVSLRNDDNYYCFKANGYYEVFITYTNDSTDVRRFWIDRTKPTISGTSGVVGNLSTVFNFSVSDADSGIQSVTIGNRTLDVDNTGNYSLSLNLKAEEHGVDVVTNTDGSIQYDEDGEVMRVKTYVTKANYTLHYPEGHVVEWSETLDTPYKNPSQAKKNFESVLTIMVADKAGNITKKEIGWDNVAPVVSGVNANTSYRGSKKITVFDTRLKSVVISKKKNKSASASNMKFEFDKASKKLTLTAGGSSKSFSISDEAFKNGTTQASGTLGNYKVVTNRNTIGTSFTITYKAGDSNTYSSLATYDENSGLSYNIMNGIFSVKATDRNNNVNSSISGVRADSASPKIKGFTNGKIYKKSITVTASDAISGIKSITVNGKKIGKNGKTYSKNGSYSVVATDKAGNIAIKSFRIQK